MKDFTGKQWKVFLILSIRLKQINGVPMTNTLFPQFSVDLEQISIILQANLTTTKSILLLSSFLEKIMEKVYS